jgi:MFS family permease
MLWVPYATTNGAWIGSKILQGFVGAPIESLCEISITDIYFTHERGTYMGLYAFMLAGSNFLAPVFAGFINDGQGKLPLLKILQLMDIKISRCFSHHNTDYQQAGSGSNTGALSS